MSQRIKCFLLATLFIALMAGGKPLGRPKKEPLSPKALLLPYQRAWVDDASRFKCGRWARQTGKSFSTMCDVVEECLVFPRHEWLVVSAGERQALVTLAKGRQWAEAYDLALDGYEELRDGGSQTVLKAAEITWSNGSKLIGIPANPDTARGYSCNVYLDEFAHHERPKEIWAAVFPSITNQFTGTKRLIVTSTPNGIGNEFHEVWKNPAFSKHTVTITRAIAEGLPANIEELRAGMRDPNAWAQEYDPLEFIDVATVLLPYDLLTTCESPEASLSIPWEWWLQSPNDKYMGIDVGRKKDLTVAWTWEAAGSMLLTRDVVALQGVSLPEQCRLLRAKVEKCTRVRIDYNGVGIGLGDMLVEEFGLWDESKHSYGKIQLDPLTITTKREFCEGMRRSYDERSVRVPVSIAIREDFHSVHRVTTKTGQISYAAAHTEDGHADHFIAAALGNMAAKTRGCICYAEVV